MERWANEKEKTTSTFCLVSSQNGKNGLNHNWCIGGCWVTAALYTGSIPAKKSWTRYQDQTSKKVQKIRQHYDQHCRGKQSCILGQGRSQVCSKVYIKQAIINTLPLPIDTMSYIFLLCPHPEHQNNPFQSKQPKTLIKETSSPDVKPVLIRYNFQKLDPML
jgi:hypothetical protein